MFYYRVDNLLTKSYEDHVNAVLAFLELDFEDEENREKIFERVRHDILSEVKNCGLILFQFQLRACLTQLATSTDDETQWKYLNFQVLLSLRSPDGAVSFLLFLQKPMTMIFLRN